MRKGLFKDNRGFTLVELVVVLVILALLAALIMPGLLGYVDGVNEKAYINNAKAAITAAQSELSSLYQSGKKKAEKADRQKWIENMNFEAGSSLSVNCYDYTEKNRRAAYTIKEALYTEGDHCVYYDGKEYVVEPVGKRTELNLLIYRDGNKCDDLTVTTVVTTE